MTNPPQLKEFTNAIESSAHDYGIDIDSDSLKALTRYYEFLDSWNDRMHLVAPTSPAEFATRHILESLVLTRYLDDRSRLADVGSGGGLPVIPCLIARRDITATLIESSKKKSVFLREALTNAKVADRATVIADRFENVETPEVEFVTCRAMERFEELLPQLIEWAPSSATMLLFGGKNLEAVFENARLEFEAVLLPNSERRFLFVTRKP